MYDVSRLRREEFPGAQAHTYFNNAAIALLPARSQARVREAVQELGQNPMAYWTDVIQPTQERLKERLAGLVGAASPAEIVPITSTGAGLAAFARSLPWQPGDNLIYCDLEFPANVYPWWAVKDAGVEIRQVPASGGGVTLAALAPHVDGRTRLVAASAIQFFSGHRTDLAAIGQFCRQRGILFVVDAIQAAGHIPLDVQGMGIDVLAAGGQKSLLGLPGLGFMVVRDELCQRLQPRPLFSNAVEDYAFWLNYHQTPQPGAARFMAGTSNVLGLMALYESVGLLCELGLENIDSHTRSLVQQARRILEAHGLEVITPEDAFGPIITCRAGVDDAGTEAAVAFFRQQGITLGHHWNPQRVPHFRLSFHCYNTLPELERLDEALGRWRQGMAA